MRAVALLGGPKEEWPQDIKSEFEKAKARHDLIVGVDRGSLLLEEMGIIPDLAVGDFDSLKKDELNKIEKSVPDIRYSNPVKDWTDTELMLKAVFEDYHVLDLKIYGATGGRIDHFLVNLLMLLNPEIRHFSEKVTLIDQQNIIKFYLSGRHLIKKEAAYPYFGVAALSSIQNLNILKAKYLLKNFSSSYPRVFASNEFKENNDSFELNFTSGFVSVIFSKDLDRFDHVIS